MTKHKTPFYNRTTKKTFIQWLRSYKTVEVQKTTIQDFKDFENKLLNQMESKYRIEPIAIRQTTFDIIQISGEEYKCFSRSLAEQRDRKVFIPNFKTANIDLEVQFGSERNGILDVMCDVSELNHKFFLNTYKGRAHAIIVDNETNKPIGVRIIKNYFYNSINDTSKNN